MKRVDLIKEIAVEFELIANRLSETEVATVASVVELEPQHLAEIAKRAQKLTGSKNVKLKTVIDKSLLAGIIIRYGNSGSKLSLITLRLLNVVCVLLCEGDDIDPSHYEADASNLSPEELEEIRRLHTSN
ncbi:hypothetical protein SASPL_108413 [Salvia splendens]|uniref:F-type H+-transporting ATPase subunit delta n=1 Tax=Salvia splendens TaxID=180675 RepID=A0A8X9A6M0_SALSN|nr:hypothetical protein SASPL_108413 [Salvia splendens]